MNNIVIKLFLFLFLFQNLINAQSLENKNVLVIYQLDPYHSPKLFVKRVVSWLEAQKAHVIVSNNLNSYSNKELMDSIDLVIQTVTMGSLNSAQEKGLTNAIKSGTGIAGSHGGLADSFRNNTLYQFMIGGQFVSHPGGNVNYTVEFTKPKNDLTKNLGMWTTQDMMWKETNGKKGNKDDHHWDIRTMWAFGKYVIEKIK